MRSARCERDRAHNRQLHIDQHLSLMLLFMFNPIRLSLRALQRARELNKDSEDPERAQPGLLPP